MTVELINEFQEMLPDLLENIFAAILVLTFVIVIAAKKLGPYAKHLYEEIDKTARRNEILHLRSIKAYEEMTLQFREYEARGYNSYIHNLVKDQLTDTKESMV